MTALPNLLPVYPEIAMVLLGMFFLLVGVFRGEDSMGFITVASIATMAVAAWLIHYTQGPATTTFGTLFAVNAFTSFAKQLSLRAFCSNCPIDFQRCCIHSAKSRERI